MILSAVPSYSDEEVNEILRRALEAKPEGLEHDDLAAAAAEIGIQPVALEKAAAQVRLDREAKALVQKRKKRRRKRFLSGLMTYVVVNAFLAALDFLTGPGWWVQWPLLIWGAMVALSAVGLVNEDDEKELERARKQVEREAAKRARKSRRKERSRSKGNLKQAERAFEDAVERGVARLLETLAQRIDDAAKPASLPADTEFGRFVAKKKNVPVRAEPNLGSGALRARVEAEQAELLEAEEEIERELSELSRD